MSSAPRRVREKEVDDLATQDGGERGERHDGENYVAHGLFDTAAHLVPFFSAARRAMIG